MIRRIVGIYFSPVGGTARMTHRLVSGIEAELKECSPVEISVDFCDIGRDGEGPVMSVDNETVAVIGMPAYIGKLPMPGVKKIAEIAGSGAMSIAAVSYGGRSYGNALFELQHILEEQDFKVIGAGAFMISYMARRGSSRSAEPAMDLESLGAFGKAASGKIKRLAGCDIEGLKIVPAPLEVNGRMPVHKISRISPAAAAIAQEVLEKLSIRKKKSEWFL